jgi:hypothetical protein
MGIDDEKFREVFDRVVAPVIEDGIAELIFDGCSREDAELAVSESFKGALEDALDELDGKG